MTLIIATTNPEGVVLCADSRQTYTNRAGIPRIASDNATKIVELGETAAVAAAGPAFFPDGGVLRSIQSYLEEFRDTLANTDNKGSTMNTAGIANALDTFCQVFILRVGEEGIKNWVSSQQGTGLTFNPRRDDKLPYEYRDPAGRLLSYDWQLQIPQFVVVGRDSDDVCRSVSITPFQGISVTQTSSDPRILWIGQGEVLNKLLMGADPFVISVATMTIQDAIDFSILLTRTTEKLHKFSDGTAGAQVGIPGVGGAIDVLLVPKKGNMAWLSKKTLRADTASG